MKSRRLTTFMMIAFLLVAAISPSLVLAAGGIPGQIVPCKGTDCTVCHLAELAQNVLNTGIYLAVFLSAAIFAFAGWKYMTAGGDSSAAGTARKMFTDVALGLIIILAAWLLVDTLMRVLVGGQVGSMPWNKIC